MTDRELLELAAKAAGINGTIYDDGISVVEKIGDKFHSYIWNPLTDDDDLVPVSEDGEGQENECPVCGAEPGSPCNGPDPTDPDGHLGVEYGRLVHRARQRA